MKYIHSLLMGLLALALTAGTAAQAATEMNELAFPGAEGYGRYATGGRGGKVYAVTSLDDCSDSQLTPGTFRWAVKQPGPKIVIFKVSGTIYLTSPLCMTAGDLTILGQTAPGDGICLADYPVTISCSNAIIRFMRFRLGNRQVAYHEGDGFGIEQGDNIILDHCSVSWSIDECLSVSEASNVTIQWCIVAQSLNNAGHQKGAHGYGGNWGGRNVSYLHNIIAHCNSRVPRLGGDGDMSTPDFVDIRNNVFYNWGGNGCYGAEGTDANFVANYYKPGPVTHTRSTAIQQRICAVGIRTNSYIKTYPSFAGALHQWGHFYVDGNVNPEQPAMTRDNWTYGIYNQIDANGADGTYTATTRDTMRLREPREFMLATTWSAEEAYRRVVQFAGCFSCAYSLVDGVPAYARDCVDQLIVDDILAGRASSQGSQGSRNGIIDSQTDNGLSASLVEHGAWPILRQVAPEFLDADGDYVRDSSEESWGLDVSNGSDGGTISTLSNASRGYSFTEYAANYLNRAVRALSDSCSQTEMLQGVTRDEMTRVTDVLPEGVHEVSVRTFKGYDPATRRQLFADGIAIEGATGGIEGGTGQELCLKLRAQQYRIYVPAGVRADRLRIYGYSNYPGTDINITEVGGERIATGTYVISAESGSRTSLDIPLPHTVSGGTISVTFAGNAPTVRFYVVDSSLATAIEQVRPDAAAIVSAPAYDLWGRPAPTAGVRQLRIRDGRKMVVR